MLSVRSEVNRMFFSSKSVISRVDKATRRVLSRFGAMTAGYAKRSIHRRNRSARPGETPTNWTGRLKRIFFGYDFNRRSVVVGPVPLPTKAGIRGIPETLEHGGRIKHGAGTILSKGSPGRDAKGKFTAAGMVARHISAGVSHVEARPTMQPAFEKNRPRIKELWRDAVK